MKLCTTKQINYLVAGLFLALFTYTYSMAQMTISEQKWTLTTYK